MTKPKTDVSATIAAGKKLSEELRAAVAQLRTRREAISSEYEALSSKNAELYRMPLRPSDAKELALLSIDKWSAEFLANWMEALAVFSAPHGFRPGHDGPVDIESLIDHGESPLPICLQDAEAILQGHHTSVYAEPARTQAGQIVRVPMLDPSNNIVGGVYKKKVDGGVSDERKRGAQAVQSACFFFGDVIKAKIENHYRAAFAKHLGESDESPSIEERRNTIADNQRRMDALSEELQTIDAQLTDMTELFKD